jgi:predicted metal-dependent HD superfamily phosphohydrolase
MDFSAARTRWVTLARRLAGKQEGLQHVQVFETVLFPRYSEQHRHYHTLDHVMACLAKVDRMPRVAHRDAVELALWFHDVVYAPFAKDNEERSADLLQLQGRGIGIPMDTLYLACWLIMLTRHGGSESVEEGAAAVMLDADLSILGEDEATFASYDAAIRQEYSTVPDELYFPARRQVLQGFLNRPRIFLTPEFLHTYELTARANLTRALTATPTVAPVLKLVTDPAEMRLIVDPTVDEVEHYTRVLRIPEDKNPIG